MRQIWKETCSEPRLALSRSTNDRQRRTWAPPERRSIWLFFFCFFFLRSFKNFRFAFLALNVTSRYFTWKISICSPKAIMFFAAHLAESSQQKELACGPVIELLHRSCNWHKLTERAARFPARASCAGSKVGAEKFALACNPTRYAIDQCALVL